MKIEDPSFDAAQRIVQFERAKAAQGVLFRKLAAAERHPPPTTPEELYSWQSALAAAEEAAADWLRLTGEFRNGSQ